MSDAMLLEQEAALAVAIGRAMAVAGNPDASAGDRQAVVEKLTEIQEDPDSEDEIVEKAGLALMEFGDGMASSAIARLEGVADGMKIAGTDLARATAIAASADRSLILPRIATVSASALTSLDTLVTALKNTGDATLEQRVTDIETAIGSLKDLIGQLPEG